MKNTTSKLMLISSLFALTCMWVAPVARANDAPDKKAERKAKAEQRLLKKYDKNGNGTIDPDEQALIDADKAEHKAKAKAKREGKQAKETVEKAGEMKPEEQK